MFPKYLCGSIQRLGINNTLRAMGSTDLEFWGFDHRRIVDNQAGSLAGRSTMNKNKNNRFFMHKIKMTSPFYISDTFRRFGYIVAVVVLVAGSFSKALSQENRLPQRIMINPLEAGNAGVAITWRIEGPDVDQYIQWLKAQANPVKDPTRYDQKQAVGRRDTVSYDGHTSVFHSYRVRLPDLTPGGSYMYRVGSEESGWSEWIQFDLPADEPDSRLTF